MKAALELTREAAARASFAKWLTENIGESLAAGGPPDPRVTKHLRSIDGTLEAAGVGVGTITATPLDVWRIGTPETLLELATTVGRDTFERALNIARVVMADADERAQKNAIKAVQRTTGPLDLPDLAMESVALELAKKLWVNPTLADDIDCAWPFDWIFQEELRELALRRRGMGLAETPGHIGLAFSGGGIRSATFNLGVLQRLAEHGLLQSVDYLSTVSGGGYIGAWLAGWAFHKGDFQSVAELLAESHHADPNGPDVDSAKNDPGPIRFLRRFSNYLTPRLGTFSFDTWAMVAVYTRNVLLNLCILVSLLGALLLVPRLLGRLWSQDWQAANYLGYVGMSLLAVAVLMIAANLAHATGAAKPEKRPGRRLWAAPLDRLNTVLQSAAELGWFGAFGVQIGCVLPLLLSICLISLWVWSNRGRLDGITLSSVAAQVVIAVVGVLSIILSLSAGLVTCLRERLRFASAWWSWGLIAMTTGPVLIVGWAMWNGYVALLVAMPGGQAGAWHALVFGAPLLLGIVSIAALLQVGLLGVNLPDAGREWLSRFRGVTNIYTIFWIALSGIAIYGPLLFAKLHSVTISTAGLLGWASVTITSFLGGKRASIDTSRWMRLAMRIGPPVFVIGFLLAIAIAEHLLLAVPGAQTGKPFFDGLEQGYWQVWSTNSLWGGSDWYHFTATIPLFLLLTGSALLLAWRVDINEFSMHHFYKNRLVRCYLGGANSKRKANSFTGFDENDDIPLSKLRPSMNYFGPYPIINVTLNLSTGSDLAWQERKGASFVFTPCYSGFDTHVAPRDAGAATKIFRTPRPFAYRRTGQYGFKEGIGLGTAMAISGAAADPNQGYHTETALAFLMTVFNVRLGWWLGNPRLDDKSKLPGPVFGLAAMLSELTGRSNDSSNFVSLTDGGHFDNLGLYELVRRKCAYIVLCDAEQDPQYQFGGLGMAIRKCRIDLKADIDINTAQIVPDPQTRRSASHCAMGQIRYEDGSTGQLLYIKSSLTGNEPEDLLEYAASHKEYPHETTTDQWFTESQFESYRSLGYEAADAALAPARQWRNRQVAAAKAEQDVPALFGELGSHWSPINPNLRQHAIKHTKTLTEILDKLRETPVLWHMGAELFPSGTTPSGLPRSPEAEFYFAMTVIQLVEDIYFDLNLDEPRWRDDPRIEGWRTLFKTWKGASAVRQAWNAQKMTFRKDFVAYWDSL